MTQPVATLDSLRAVATGPREQNLPAVQAGFGNLQSFELAQRAAKLLSMSTLVPEQYRGNLANCVVALEMAQRMGASALMVMQNLYVVQGRPSWSSQFVIASINQSKRFTALRYEWTGAEGSDDWGCRAWATEKATGERLVGPLVTIRLAKAEGWTKKSGSKWLTIPQLMMMYRAGAWFGRTYAPELTMGLRTSDEEHEVIDLQHDGSGHYTVDTAQLQAQAHAVVDQRDPTPAPFTFAQLLDMMKAATTADALDEIATLIESAPTDQQAELRDEYNLRREQVAA